MISCDLKSWGNTVIIIIIISFLCPQTALHLAVHTQQIDIIRKLLLSGASLNVPDHKGNTALHIAAQFSSTKSLEELALYVPMQTLLEVATTRNNEGQTCVHVAAQYGNTDVLRKLKSYGVNIDMQVSKRGVELILGMLVYFAISRVVMI